MDTDTLLSKMTRSIIEGDREQAETLALAVLAGINVISGPGMLDFESCQSLEKLVIDNEICGMALRLVRGIEQRDEDLALPLFDGFSAGTQFLTIPHTRRWYREEHIFPDIIDRDTYDAWVSSGEKDIGQRAADRVEPELLGRLRAIMQADAEKNGIDALPGLD